MAWGTVGARVRNCGLIFGHGAGWIAHSAFVQFRAAWSESGKRFAAREAAAREAEQKKKK